jgi:nickel superoxide dismutase
MFKSVLNLLPHNTAYAHCDIPCGIYDPHNAQMAAHTIIRMTELLGLIKREDELKAEHDVTRVTRVKEQHSDILEAELVTLEKDYFKDEMLEKFPELKDLFSKASKLGTKARTGIDIESAKELLKVVMKISETFYDSKDLDHKRVKSPYPTGLDIVVQA